MTDNPARLVAEGVEKSLSIAMTWHVWDGRFVTLDSDWARLTEPDFDEAASRLRRLARTYLLTYEMAGPGAWNAPRTPAWTRREIAEHVSGVSAYAEYVGNLR